MRRIALFVAVAILALAGAALAQSPSIFTSSSADFSQVHRVAFLSFTVGPGVEDPFAATKATEFLESALARRGVALVNLADVFRDMKNDTGHTFSNPPTEDDQRVWNTNLPRYVDASLIGRVSAWGTLVVQGTRVLHVPVYGWGSGSGTGTVYGPGVNATITGNWTSQWHSTQAVPITVTQQVSVVGLTAALLRLYPDGRVSLFWQYSHVALSEGRGLRRAAPPDTVVQQLCTEIAAAYPVH